MHICPKCGKPGGVMLFMSIAPCEKCVAGESYTQPISKHWWVVLRTKRVITTNGWLYSGKVPIIVPPMMRFGAWVYKREEGNPPEARLYIDNVVNLRAEPDCFISLGLQSITGWHDFRVYWE